MFVRLKSYKEGNTLLVSLDQVTHIAPRAAGGSTIYFAMEATDPAGRETKQRLLAVRDTIEDIARQIELTSAPVARNRAA